jgi:hypothetical protein
MSATFGLGMFAYSMICFFIGSLIIYYVINKNK